MDNLFYVHLTWDFSLTSQELVHRTHLGKFCIRHWPFTVSSSMDQFMTLSCGHMEGQRHT